MPPSVRKIALTAHVVSSVGWLGAVVVFFALAVVGLTSADAQTVRGAYIAMGSTTWLVLVPLAFASLLTGVVQSLGTPWGLFRHYWVLIKFGITVFSTYILWGYTSTLTSLADAAAASPTPSGESLEMLRSPSVVVHSGVALLLLLVTTTLSVYKPRGMTRYGQRKQRQQRSRREALPQPEQRPVLVP
ncbi:MAG: DUF2269 domain-containing protein [Acidimicrobiia bacterium]